MNRKGLSRSQESSKEMLIATVRCGTRRSWDKGRDDHDRSLTQRNAFFHNLLCDVFGAMENCLVCEPFLTENESKILPGPACSHMGEPAHTSSHHGPARSHMGQPAHTSSHHGPAHSHQLTPWASPLTPAHPSRGSSIQVQHYFLMVTNPFVCSMTTE